MSKLLSKKEIAALLLILASFVLLHVAGLHQPYHQDEYKWVLYSHPEIIAPGTVPHPPLTEFIYADSLGPLVGDDNFRMIPFAFGILDLVLIYCLARTIFGRKAAVWTALLFTVSFYSLLATLMVDVDGAIMPAFFLLAAIGYYQLKHMDFRLKGGGSKWLALLIVGAIGGFLIKVSAVLPLLALALDFALVRNVFADRKKLARYVLWIAGGACVLALILVSASLVFPFFNLGHAIVYWEHFADSSSFLGRGWFQTFVQFAKSVMYLSPLLIVGSFFADADIRRKARPFIFFALFGLVFYLFLFDFSLGALDRYFQFLVVPLCLIAGAALARLPLKKYAWAILASAAAGLAIFLLQFLPQAVPALYPKTEWLVRLVSFKWNFLFPFTGGSGPLGFYVSFLFIALIWLASLGLILAAIKYKPARDHLLVCVLVLGLLYNGVFIEEYLAGHINGSAPTLVHDTTAYVADHPEIRHVIVYNDNGGWNIRELGVYDRRMYATPEFEDEYEKVLSDWSGYITLVDIPRVPSGSFYSGYFDSCKDVFEETSGYITGKVLDCTKP